jgi:integral membrane protein
MQALPWLRRCGIAEGISFLLLLCIAMPLKYLLNWPLAVKITGWIHGVLFVLYVSLAFYVKIRHRWPLKKFAGAFLAAWLPLGTFYFDRLLKKEQQAMQA